MVATWRLSGLCVPGFDILLNAKHLKCLQKKFLAKDSAEREAALALRRPLAEENLARGEEGLFAARSRLMGKVPFNLTIADLLESDIDLDADAHPLKASCSLAMSGRDTSILRCFMSNGVGPFNRCV
jgi:hypothetical protein